MSMNYRISVTNISPKLNLPTFSSKKACLFLASRIRELRTAMCEVSFSYPFIIDAPTLYFLTERHYRYLK